MKTRLLIASIFTFAVASVLAVTLRTTASAQQDVEPPAAGTSAPADSTPGGETAGPNDSYVVPRSEPGEVTVWDENGDATPEQEDIASEDGVEESAEELDSTAADSDMAGEGSEEEAAMTFNFNVEVEEAGVARNEENDTITVDFPDEEIRTILRLVADMFELNLVIPETLTGRASITLRNVTWRQVFDVVLSPVGFTYVEDENIIKIVSLESLTLEPAVTVVVILDYAQAEGILPSIEPLVSAAAGGRIQIDRRSNALVITERPNRLRRIEEIIAELDRPNIQVMIESKFVETRNRHLENIGVNWASLDGYEVRAGPFDHGYTRERGSSSDRGQNRLSGSESTGGTTSQTVVTNGGSTTTTTTTSSTQAGSSNESFDSSGSFANTTRLSTAVFSADQFNVILSALRTTNDVKLVSNPTVVTLNNRPARIHVGEEFPVVLPRFNPQTGSYEAGEYNTIDIGIKLDVTPQVNNAGFINLDVEPQVSSLSSTVSYFGADYPIVATRNARTEVTIRDGYTVAIGGLVQDDTLNVEKRVPVLGSIPGLGRLFRSDSKDNDQRNLIIFLTARTLSPEGSTVEEIVDPRTIHRMGISREELPGYRPDVAMWPDSPTARTEPKAATDLGLDYDAGLRSEGAPAVAGEPVDVAAEGTEDRGVPAGDSVANETVAGEAPGTAAVQEGVSGASTERPTERAPERTVEPTPAPRSSRGWLTP